MKKNHTNTWELISTWFYVGKARHAPGTVGSLAALPLVYLLNSYLGSGSVVVFVVLVSLLGIIAAEKYFFYRFINNIQCGKYNQPAFNKSGHIFIFAMSERVLAVSWFCRFYYREKRYY